MRSQLILPLKLLLSTIIALIVLSSNICLKDTHLLLYKSDLTTFLSIISLSHQFIFTLCLFSRCYGPLILLSRDIFICYITIGKHLLSFCSINTLILTLKRYTISNFVSFPSLKSVPASQWLSLPHRAQTKEQSVSTKAWQSKAFVNPFYDLKLMFDPLNSSSEAVCTWFVLCAVPFWGWSTWMLANSNVTDKNVSW